LEDYDSYIKYWTEMLWLWTRWRGEFFFRPARWIHAVERISDSMFFFSLCFSKEGCWGWPELAIKGSSRAVDLRTCAAAHFWFIARGRSFRKQTARKLIEEF